MNLRRSLAAAATPLGWRLALALSASIVAVAQWVAPVRLPGRASPPAAAERPAIPQQRAGGAARADYPAIAAHPLFFPSRRPWVPPAVPPKPTATATAPALAQYTVLGVILGHGTRTAFLKSKKGGKTVIVSEGEALEGWTLRRIGRGKLHFVSGGAAYDLPLPVPRWPAR